jgi:hypothetical protein
VCGLLCVGKERVEEERLLSGEVVVVVRLVVDADGTDVSSLASPALYMGHLP